MIKFRSIDRLLQFEQGTIAKHPFMAIGIALIEYEELYTKWLNNIIKYLPIYLKQSLLVDAEQRPDLFLDNTNNNKHHDQQFINNSPTYRLPLYITKKDLNRMSI
ncbi:unnamed protein product [Rotaria sp. Silwood2]|nr:unnamed protein product [Rotaria sp. Silwood2]